MKKFWEKNKGWLQPILIVLLGLLGYDQGPAAYDAVFGTAIEEPTTEEVKPVWTVTALLYLDKATNGAGVPSVEYTDLFGPITWEVEYPKKPSEPIIIAAFPYPLNREKLHLVKGYEVKAPKGWKEDAME